VASQMLFAAGPSTDEIRKVLVERMERAGKWDALEHCVCLVVSNRTSKSVQLQYQRATTLQEAANDAMVYCH